VDDIGGGGVPKQPNIYKKQRKKKIIGCAQPTTHGSRGWPETRKRTSEDIRGGELQNNQIFIRRRGRRGLHAHIGCALLSAHGSRGWPKMRWLGLTRG